MENTENETDAQDTIYVVSTSHMDWDWSTTFESYYTSGWPSSTNGDLSVGGVLYNAIDLIKKTGTSALQQYQYNLAEVAWMQRFLNDFPDHVEILKKLQGKFYFLGGGITSPDNLVCNGEAFIRTYLTGRQYLKSIGLEKLISDVCWMPDDFGHDPQLPVVMKAMQMKGFGFARVNGNQPKRSNGTYFLPLDQNYLPLSNFLKTKGVAFNWIADNGDSLPAYFMFNFSHGNPGYGTVWDQSNSAYYQYLSLIVTEPAVGSSGDPNVAPGNLYVAPCGGDFSTPSESFIDFINDFNAGQNGNSDRKIVANFETFEAYLDALKATGAPLANYQGLDSSNYWTGHFCSRMQLKLDQQKTVTSLMAAETLSTMLSCLSSVSGASMNSLNDLIDTAWEHVAPSTHHDYITGTCGDEIYWGEQFPLSQLALTESQLALSSGMELLGQMVDNPQKSKDCYVVFNPTGATRNTGLMVTVKPRNRRMGFNQFTLDDGTTGPLHQLRNGTLAFVMPPMPSMSYRSFTIQKGPTTGPGPELPSQDGDTISFENDLIKITIDRTNAWAISSIYDKTNAYEMVVAGAYCNELLSVSEGTYGNIYQMGNELSTPSLDGFDLPNAQKFSTVNGRIIENGPQYFHFKGKISHPIHGKYTVEYFLFAGEPMVRVRIKGQIGKDGSNGYSAVTRWSLNDRLGSTPQAMVYGTGNHFNDPSKHSNEAWGYTPYWEGPTFRSTHDFLTIATETDGLPMGAIYHQGMRAWTLDQSQLLGILFRNAPGIDRGAFGYDLATHTQDFAFRLAGGGNAESCQPLIESYCFQQPLLVQSVGLPNTSVPLMQQSGQLASVSGNAVIRLARTQKGSGGVNVTTNAAGSQPSPFSFVLRIYRPGPEGPLPTVVDVPVLGISAQTPKMAMVSALEENPLALPSSALNGSLITLDKPNTLSTLWVQAYRQKVPQIKKP